MSNLFSVLLLLKIVSSTSSDLIVKQLSEIIECAHQSRSRMVPDHCFGQGIKEHPAPTSLSRSGRNLRKELFFYPQDYCQNTKCSLHELFLSIEHLESHTNTRMVGINTHPSVVQFNGEHFLNIGMCGGYCPQSLVRRKDALYDSIHETDIAKNVGCAATRTSSIRLITKTHEHVDLEDVITHGCKCAKFHSCL